MIAGRPAHPIATFTSPLRQGRPNVSVMTTPRRERPRRCASDALRASADASGSTGSSETNPSSTLDASTPAFAQTNP